MNRPAATPDQRQADYFLGLLTQICKRINLRIDIYQRATAIADIGGSAEYARGLKHLTRIDEQDRKIIEGLIDQLQGRFVLPAPDEAPPISRRARLRGPLGRRAARGRADGNPGSCMLG